MSGIKQHSYTTNVTDMTNLNGFNIPPLELEDIRMKVCMATYTASIFGATTLCSSRDCIVVVGKIQFGTSIRWIQILDFIFLHHISGIMYIECA